MDTTVLFQQLGISVLLGLLVGLQREHSAAGTAGVRTFPLITVLGTVSAVLAGPLGGWVPAAGLLGIVAVLILGHLAKLRQPEPDLGNTTNIAMLLMFLVGALLTMEGAMPVAIAVGGGVAVLLQFKPELHLVAKRLGDDELKAIMQFVLITCIILPVLPDRTYGPPGIAGLDVLNPRETWLMVVLIVGMSLGGYITYKFLGRNAGILLGGVLGGAISSTATTVSYSRRATESHTATRSAVIVVLIASTVVYVRVLIEVAVVEPALLRTTAVPVLVLMLLTLLPAMLVWFWSGRQPAAMPEQGNPTQLKSAVMFGLMYALVLLALAAAEKYSGDRGLYAVAGLSGLTDMDAITLSTARMAGEDAAILIDGWRLIVVASMANLVFKAAIAGILGGWHLFRQIALLFCVPLSGGAAMLAFWGAAR